jgi:photosystem II stability/assembly factor-like uncharacterized protein
VVLSIAVERSGRIYLGYEESDRGIIVSGDGGVTWDIAYGQHSYALASSPAAGIAYAVLHHAAFFTTQGVARSDDGGLTWLQQNSFLAHVVATDAMDADTIYLGYGRCERVGPCGDLYRSEDAGRTVEWLAHFEARITSLGMSVDGSRFWLATQDGWLHQSRDRGLTWEAATQIPEGGWIRSLSVIPQDPNLVFAVTSDATLWVYREE